MEFQQRTFAKSFSAKKFQRISSEIASHIEAIRLEKKESLV